MVNLNTKAAFGYTIVVLLGVGLLFGGMIWREQRNRHRLETMPHVPGTILSFQRRKGGIRAWIEFARMENGNSIACRTEVNLGTGSVAVGQTISVVPRPDSCGEPAVAIGR